MRKFLLIIIFISCSQKTRSKENIDLNGMWEADNVYTITFKPNENFEISFDDKKAKNTFKGKFSVRNFNNIKILDLKKIEKFNGSLFGIFKFLDFNTIKISKFSNFIKTRPVSFEKDNYLILKRKK